MAQRTPWGVLRWAEGRSKKKAMTGRGEDEKTMMVMTTKMIMLMMDQLSQASLEVLIPDRIILITPLTWECKVTWILLMVYLKNPSEEWQRLVF